MRLHNFLSQNNKFLFNVKQWKVLSCARIIEFPSKCIKNRSYKNRLPFHSRHNEFFLATVLFGKSDDIIVLLCMINRKNIWLIYNNHILLGNLWFFFSVCSFHISLSCLITTKYQDGLFEKWFEHCRRWTSSTHQSSQHSRYLRSGQDPIQSERGLTKLSLFGQIIL